MRRTDDADVLSALWTMPETLSPQDIAIGTDHKTVIALDHSPDFATSSNHKISVALRDPVTAQMRTVCSIEKSLWSCAVESALELHRIVEEIYPDGMRLIRFVVSDFVGRFLTPRWGTQLIPYDQLLRSFANCGVPDAKADLSSCSIINGISMAVEAISELTELQKLQREKSAENERRIEEQLAKQLRESVDGKNDENGEFADQQLKVARFRKALFKLNQASSPKKTIPNNGSMIVFTSLKSDEDIAMLSKHITEDIISRNKIVRALDGDRNFAPISHVYVYFIILYPVADGNREKLYQPTSKPLTKLNEFVSCSVICAEAGSSLRPILHGRIAKHYDLASTTVTSIPMKEEAQQGISVNYDVELFHSKRSHRCIQQLGITGPESKSKCTVEPGNYETVRLSWMTSTAKNKFTQYPRCISSLPISPANSNSRPSVCLTSFVASGRHVMLEVLRQHVHPPCNIPPNLNQKLISHLLECHAERIYLHTIHIGEHAILDDKRLLSDAIIPKPKTLVRVADFAALMKESQLDVRNEIGFHQDVFNEAARKHLKRITRFWPIRLSEAFIYNIPKRFDPLLTFLRRRTLTADDVDACRRCLEYFKEMIDSKEPLTSKTIDCGKFTNPLSREEQFKIACEELREHLHNYANHSYQHLQIAKIFEDLLGLKQTARSFTDVSVGECRFIGLIIDDNDVTKVPLASVDAKDDEPVAKKLRTSPHHGQGEQVDYYHLLLDRYYRKRWSNWKDFVGRQIAGKKPAVLYPHLDINKPKGSEPVMSVD